MKKIPFRQTLMLFFLLAALTGIIYPVFIILLSQFCFPFQANGSLLFYQGEPIGSKLIAQEFKSPKYFWPRPSAIDYNPLPSGGSNLSLISPALKNLIEARKAALRASTSLPTSGPLPEDLLFSSGSGLDPHISVQTALFQAPRVAAERKWDLKVLENLIHTHAEGDALGMRGMFFINVLELNVAIDKLTQEQAN